MPTTLEAHFGDLPDSRVTGRCRYRLLDLIVMAICAGLTGVQNWVEVATFVQIKRDWLQGFMELDEALPSHDTFGRVFGNDSPARQITAVVCRGASLCAPA